jgi:tetratricopeptide (TPR) repeat protein
MPRILFILFLLIITTHKSFACLNGETEYLNGNIFLYEDRDGNIPEGHVFISDDGCKEGLKTLDSFYRATGNLDYLSDQGYLLILLKQYDRAIALYQKMESMSPNRYSTASNIGTAYELNGENEKALMWIKKAVRIDSNSHKNSEWIHVRILEAKIQGPEKFTTRFLLNTDFGDKPIPMSTLTRDNLFKLSAALYYQLNERISFIAPKEKLVAQLLFDLGNIAFLLGNYEDAIGDYEKAKEYGFTGPLIENRLRLSNNGRMKAKVVDTVTQPTNFFIIGISIFILLTVIIWILYRRGEKKL